MNIKDIIFDFRNKFGLSGLWSKPTSYMEYEDVTNKVEDYLQSSLTSLLDSIKKELPNEQVISEEDGYLDDEEDYHFCDVKQAWNKYRQEVINIINSHR